MIVKRNLSPKKVVQYTAGPMVWAIAWAIAAPTALELTSDSRLALPFAPVAALGAALAIFIAFRDNSSFSRWNEARSAWQTVLVASRVLGRQVIASTENAISAGSADAESANGFAREFLLRLAAYAYLLAGRIRPDTDWARVAELLSADEVARVRRASNAPNVVLARQGVRIKDGIREGVLGQFDPISLEPQLGALNAAQGVIERIKHTPTPRQYDFFTRRFVQLFALPAPFGLLSLVPSTIWLATPLSIVLSGVFIIMAVTGSANEDPFENKVTDVPIRSICIEIERDLRELAGDTDLPPAAVPINGYLW